MNFTTNEPPFRFRQGTRPLLISMPHVGTHVPPALDTRLTDEARGVPDTDWHLERLYRFADELGASVLVATHSRYVIDLNRPPDGASLYPGQSVTGLCPVDTFDNTPLYRDPADAPSDAEVAARRDAIWLPYHAQLSRELARLKGDVGAKAAQIVGQDFVDQNIGIWSRMIPVLDSGEHCPTHLAARKP